MKFSDELASKDMQLNVLQTSAKKKQKNLETKLVDVEKKSIDEIAKLNAKLNKQESLVSKYFGVENEMISLRSAIMTKDNEISTLRSQI